MTTAYRTRTRRTPTQEQREAAQLRRERFSELAARVAALPEAERQRLVSLAGGIVTVEGRTLSTFNSCLLISQRPGVSCVGGLWQWKNHGRRVRKGEKALALWIPINAGTRDDGSAPINAAEAGSEANAERSGRRGRFTIGSVFDVSQTDPERGQDDDTPTEPRQPIGWDSVRTPEPIPQDRHASPNPFPESKDERANAFADALRQAAARSGGTIHTPPPAAAPAPPAAAPRRFRITTAMDGNAYLVRRLNDGTERYIQGEEAALFAELLKTTGQDFTEDDAAAELFN